MELPNKRNLVAQSTGDSSKMVEEKVSAVKISSIKISSKVCTVVVTKNTEFLRILMDVYIVDNLMVCTKADLDTKSIPIMMNMTVNGKTASDMVKESSKTGQLEKSQKDAMINIPIENNKISKSDSKGSVKIMIKEKYQI
jgi:hypothetical protein